MSGETGQLQQLTDEQVNARLAAYNADGALDRDVALLREQCRRPGHGRSRRRNSARNAPTATPPVYTGKIDAAWIQHIARLWAADLRRKSVGPRLHGRRTPRSPAASSPRSASVSPTIRQRWPSACAPSTGIEMIETDIILAQVSLLEAIDAADVRGRENDQFERRVSDLVRATSEQTKSLTDRTRSTAASARGMLGKTSEVAAAAEQSAVAMREAAQTAAGLIRAIEDARSEVEVAADVATRAGDQASQAVKVSQALSRPRRGDRIDPQPDPRHRRPDQPARAQRHHRGGARGRCRPRLRGRRPGSEEPRPQTARATDDITAKITAIQQATRQTVDANGSIQGTVEEVQTSADRIREAMELQAQTVTMITAAVDETALAAEFDELDHRRDPQRHRKCRQGHRPGRTGLRPLFRADRRFQVDRDGVRQRRRSLTATSLRGRDSGRGNPDWIASPCSQ